MLYHLNTHAVLMEWRIEGVGSDKTIFVARDASSLFKKITNYILINAEKLIDHHHDVSGHADPDTLRLDLIYGSRPDKKSDVENIKRLLIDLINEQRDYLNDCPATPTILGDWYRLIEYLNAVTADDYLCMTIEGPIPVFAREMAGWLRLKKKEGNLLNIREARWNNILSAIAVDERWWMSGDTWKLSQFIAEFNKIHNFNNPIYKRSHK